MTIIDDIHLLYFRKFKLEFLLMKIEDVRKNVSKLQEQVICIYILYIDRYILSYLYEYKLIIWQLLLFNTKTKILHIGLKCLGEAGSCLFSVKGTASIAADSKPHKVIIADGKFRISMKVYMDIC